MVVILRSNDLPTGQVESSLESRGSARGDVATAVASLRRFRPDAVRHLAGVGACAFASGTFEALTLAMLTASAVAATGAGEGAGLGPLSFSSSQGLFMAAVALVLRLASGYLLAVISSRLVSQAGLAARTEVLGAFHGASYQEKVGRRVATLQERLTSYVDRFQVAFNGLVNLISNALSLMSFTVLALIVDPLALVGLGIIGVLASAVQRPFARLARHASLTFSHQRSGYAESVTESVLLAREMTVFGVGGAASTELNRLDVEVADSYRRTLVLAQVKSLVYYGLALGLAIGGLSLVREGSQSGIASIGAVALILLRSLSYGQSLLSTLHGLTEQRPFIDQLTQLLDDYQASAAATRMQTVGDISNVKFCDVSFSYGDSPALSGASFSVDAAEAIGIVGPSGAGKTTLVNLLLRLYEPTEGTVTVNGIAIGDIEDARWHELTAIVPQEPRLLHGTIAENIRFFRDLSDEAIEAAAEGANIASFIRSLPHGFDSAVGELGQNLSGGQRQRICIARALAGNPQLLVLDEPTSALDGESEAAIQATLSDLKGQVTMFIVAHRLSTLSICDRIMVVEGGRIADLAQPTELLERSTYFSEATQQARWS